jgi:hypothetical protein
VPGMDAILKAMCVSSTMLVGHTLLRRRPRRTLLYYLAHTDRRYDSNAVAIAAHGYELPAERPSGRGPRGLLTPDLVRREKGVNVPSHSAVTIATSSSPLSVIPARPQADRPAHLGRRHRPLLQSEISKQLVNN